MTAIVNPNKLRGNRRQRRAMKKELMRNTRKAKKFTDKKEEKRG
jgi:hypothetical protein